MHIQFCNKASYGPIKVVFALMTKEANKFSRVLPKATKELSLFKNQETSP